MVKFQTFMLNHVGVANLETNGRWHENFKSTSSVQVVIDYPMRNILCGLLIPFQPSRGTHAQYKRKKKTKRRGATFWGENRITQQQPLL